MGPSKLEDPVRYYIDQPTDFQHKHILLSCQYVDSIGDIKSLIILVDVTRPCQSYSDVVQDQLVGFMAMLNHVFFVPADTEGNQHLVLETPTDIETFVLNDRSLLTRAVAALASGNTIEELLPKGLSSNTYHKSNFLAIWVAIEMMRRATQTRPGILQDFIQHHLTLHLVPQDVKNLLTKFRIAASRNRMRLRDIEKVNAKITAGWDLDGKRHWMCYMLYDNLGFRKRGARAGYDQYTMVLNHMIAPKDHKKINYFSHETDSQTSRATLNMAQTLNSINFYFKRLYSTICTNLHNGLSFFDENPNKQPRQKHHNTTGTTNLS